MPQELAALLGQSSLLRDLPVAQLVKLASEGTPRVFRAREMLYTDSTGGSVFFVQFGRVRLHLPTPVGDMFVSLVRPGELPGLEQVFDVSPHVTAIALDSCSTTVFPVVAFKTLLAENPEFGSRLSTRIHRIAVGFMDRLADMACCSVQERLLRFLIRQAETYGIAANSGGTLIDIGLSHLDLAASVGTSRETATTVLNSLKQDGLLDIGRKTITLHDIPRMRKLARMDPTPG